LSPPGLVLLDVEGTTTPVDFVVRVLFADARARARDFLEAHANNADVAVDVAGLRTEHARDTTAGARPPHWDDTPAAIAAYVRWLMDQDRKLTALKSLQGRIWAEGYAAGRLRGQVYDDVPPALERWTRSGRRVAVFSSGSVLAQKLLFRYSDHGDLTPFLSSHFDTATGPKREAGSYRAIRSALQPPASAGLFVSDVVAELDAARDAGFDTALAVRTPPGPAGRPHRVIRSFDDLP
jgi:enolase-phosphatase E1